MSYTVHYMRMISANEEEVTLAVWLRDEGEYVKKGQEIAQIESTKAVEDVFAEDDGYLFYLVEMGEKVPISSPYAVISKENDSSVKKLVEKEKIRLEKTSDDKADRRWTKKAAILARKKKIDIESIPAAGIIQEADVLNFIKRGAPSADVNDLVADVYPGNIQERVTDVYSGDIQERVILLGGGRGAVQVIDSIQRGNRQKAVGILDDNESLHGKKIMGVDILGSIDMVHELWENKKFDALAITFSNALEKRAALYEKLSVLGLPFTNVIDPTVQIHSNVSIGTGNVIIANCRIGACAIIGNNNFFSAYINLEHHNVLGNHCTFGPGVFTSSRVQIDDRVKFGTGIFIEPGVRIGAESIISSGSILTTNVDERSIVKKRKDLIVQKRDEK
jgi:sugar O-acyltransferase (sialic acid O-acetyltransferase NeuD family)